MTAANFLSNPQHPAPVLISSGGQSAHGQPSATNNETPTVLGWGFFLPDRAGSRVFLGVPAEACGLHQPPELAVPGHIPLSPGHSSLRPRSLELARCSWRSASCSPTSLARCCITSALANSKSPRERHMSILASRYSSAIPTCRRQTRSSRLRRRTSPDSRR